MVHLLASTGVAATIIAAALLTSASVKQQVAVASIQNYSNVNVSNVECTVANIGVFESTYTPECSNFPGTKFTSETTEFWPVFPAQNSYGAFGPGGMPDDFKLVNLTGEEFTYCIDYMTRSYSNVSYVANAAFAGLTSAGITFDMISNGCIADLPSSLVEPLALPDNGTDCGLITNCTGMSFAECTYVMYEEFDEDPMIYQLVDLLNNKCVANELHLLILVLMDDGSGEHCILVSTRL